MLHCVVATHIRVVCVLHHVWPEGALAPESSTADARGLAMLLLYLLIFVVVFLFATYAILRASRRFRESLSMRKPERTDASDVWAMHKVPEELDPNDANSDSAGGNGE